MEPASLSTFLLASLVLTLTPGVDTILVMRNVLRGGRSDGLVTTLGICSGLFVHATLSACGISVLLLQSALLFGLLKTAGALYLIWLGLRSLCDTVRGKSLLTLPTERFRGESHWKLSLREGLLSNVLNPKPILFYMAFLPQFIGPSDPVLLKSLGLAGLHFLMGIVWLGLISCFLQQVKTWLGRPAVTRTLNGLCGIVLLFFGIQLGLARR